MAPPIILPYIDDLSSDAIQPAYRLGHVLFPSSADTSSVPTSCNYTILCSADEQPSVDQVITWLDGGADRVILPSPAYDEALSAGLPSHRLVQRFTLGKDSNRSDAAAVLLHFNEALENPAIESFQQSFKGDLLVLCDQPPTEETIRSAASLGVPFIIPLSQLTTSDTSSTKLNIADAFLAPLISDRPDGLIPTLVTAYPQTQPVAAKSNGTTDAPTNALPQEKQPQTEDATIQSDETIARDRPIVDCVRTGGNHVKVKAAEITPDDIKRYLGTEGQDYKEGQLDELVERIRSQTKNNCIDAFYGIKRHGGLGLFLSLRARGENQRPRNLSDEEVADICKLIGISQSSVTFAKSV